MKLKPPTLATPGAPTQPPSAPLPAALDLTADTQRPGPPAAPSGPQCAAIAIAEVLDFPARLMISLPAPWTLTVQRHDGSRLIVTAARDVYAAARAAGLTVVPAGWLHPLALAAEHDRGNWVTLTEWLGRLVVSPSWTLTPEYAIGPVYGQYKSKGWAMRHVLSAYALHILDIQTHGETS
jgi:hypothetical protein